MKKRRVRHSAEQIVRKLRAAEKELAHGATVAQVVQRLEVSEQTYYRWKWKYGGMEVQEAVRLKNLEHENERLKRLLAGQMLDNAMLKGIPLLPSLRYNES